jgi:hypothetical protein
MGLSVSAGFSSYERVSELVEEKACIAKWTDAPMRGIITTQREQAGRSPLTDMLRLFAMSVWTVARRVQEWDAVTKDLVNTGVDPPCMHLFELRTR